MIRIKVTNERQNADFEHESGPFEFGRGPQRDTPRLVIEDPYVSRDQLCVEPLESGKCRVTNLGAPVRISDPPQRLPFDATKTATAPSSEMAAGEVIELPLPLRVTVGYTTIEFLAAVEGFTGAMQTLSRPVMARDLFGPAQKSLNDLGDVPNPEVLTEWFERLLKVQRAAAGSDEFYQETAQAIVELIGLDRGLVLLRQDNGWEIAARYARRESDGPDYSRKVLEQIMREKRTFFQGLKQVDQLQSLAGVEAVVASPVFDDQQDVTGVVYGCRDMQTSAGQAGIKPLEAQVVQLLAAAVSTGLARVQREAEALRARVQFEQFFSHELAKALERNPQMLEGQQREVTALFVDVRSFSRICERLDTANTYNLLHDVMDLLTDQVMARDGVVIDYHGDGLAAMWNAPVDHADPAEQACLAALAMHRELHRLNTKWEPMLGFPLRIGTGLNTGPAQVGNAGSSRRLKYGPMGHTVNLASRVEGATKQFGVNVLITEATASQLSEALVTRRICRVRVVGIDGDAVIYELQEAPGDERWLVLKERYENSLAHFEAGRLQESQESLRALLTDFPKDKAAQALLATVDSVQQHPDKFSAIIELSSK